VDMLALVAMQLKIWSYVCRWRGCFGSKVL